MEYYVLIGGQKRFCSKREANEIMIDEFLNGTNGIDFKIYDTKTNVVCG